jgi:UPF0755 protein
MSAIKQITNLLRQLGNSIKLTIPVLMAAVRKTGARLKPYARTLLAAVQRAAKSAIPVLNQLLASLLKSFPKYRTLYLLLLPLFSIVISVKILHTRYYGPNVAKSFTLFIRDNDNFEKVAAMLKAQGALKNTKSFEQLAAFKDYDTHVKPGAYKVQEGWSNNQLVNVLRSGAQTPVMVTFNNIRTFEELSGKLARQLQGDSLTFLHHFKNDSVAVQFGITPKTLSALFIPNTYSLYWTTSPSGFLTRMKSEYEKFWNESRKLKAKNAGLTQDQVSTLASIVQEESNKNDEKPVIAGVYLNRLRKNWPLQADPTIRFALGDFTIRRVLTAQLAVQSPYNTYLKTGLPPGPINFPEISSLEAVLNYRVHDYFYFCAKEDFSGYHNFAKTLSEHNRNARRYQAALNRKKVYK